MVSFLMWCMVLLDKHVVLTYFSSEQNMLVVML